MDLPTQLLSAFAKLPIRRIGLIHQDFDHTAEKADFKADIAKAILKFHSSTFFVCIMQDNMLSTEVL